jgi:hypothetical protein
MNINEYDKFGLCCIDLPISKIIDIIKSYEETNRIKMDYGFHPEQMCNKVITGSNNFEAVFYSSELVEYTLLVGYWTTLCNFICNKTKAKNYWFFFEFNRSVFEYFENGISQRVIQSIVGDEEKWEFFQKGEPLFFENTDNYKKHKISNRINKAIIVNYIQNLGIPILDKQCFAFNKKSLWVSW